MNYSIILSTKRELKVCKEKLEDISKKINSSLLTLSVPKINYYVKKRAWETLRDHAGMVMKRIKNELSRLNNVRFSEDEFILDEEKENLIKEWKNVESSLLTEMETIHRQIDEKKVALLVPFSLQQKSLKLGFCYLCNINISGKFSYKLKEEEKRILEIELVKGAEFCSRKCFLDYCKQYKKHEKLHREERKKNQKKIEQDQVLISETQSKITNLIQGIDKLEKQELELELTPPEKIQEENEKVGFFRRLLQKLGLVKKTDAASLLEKVRKKKAELEDELEVSRDKLKSIWISLAADKQAEQEHLENERKLLQQKEENTVEEEDE